MAEPVIAAAGVVKKYQQVAILDGVDLAIHAGEAVSIVAPSGTGKTTLLLALAGLLGIDSGTVQLGDVEPHKVTAGIAAKHRAAHLGFVYQHHHLLDQLTVSENIALPCVLAGATMAEAMVKAVALLEEFGLQELRDRSPQLISGGERQRVAVLRSFVHLPRAVLLDEPTGSLDLVNAMKVTDTLMKLSTQFGVAIVCATHDQRVSRVMQRHLTLEDGKLLETEAV